MLVCIYIDYSQCVYPPQHYWILAFVKVFSWFVLSLNVGYCRELPIGLFLDLQYDAKLSQATFITDISACILYLHIVQLFHKHLNTPLPSPSLIVPV